jgi:membrane peptidoglycan carboxypeptidase
MRIRRRFAVLAAAALVLYGLAAWLFLLPPLRLPPSQLLAGGCPATDEPPQSPSEQPILFVPLEAVPDHLVGALVAREDAFYYHHGVDWGQLVRAFWRNWYAGEYQFGGSTLTMQLARELFLGKERSLLRKLREISYALQVERRLSKDEILELYLNVVHWGPGLRGVGAASCAYFGVPPSALDEEETRRLVAVLPSPERLGPALASWADRRRRASRDANAAAEAMP